jgi:hypothetical protein
MQFTWEELREHWIARGMHWFFGRPPQTWNPQVQLLAAGYGVKFSVASERSEPGLLDFSA